jgi:hypothetical protein
MSSWPRLSGDFCGLARLLISTGFGLLTKAAREIYQRGTILQWIEKAFWDCRQAYLGAHQCARTNGARLVLATAVQGVQHSSFKIIVKSCRQVVRSGELMINRAGHAVNDGYLPRWFDLDARIECGFGHVGGRQ